MKALKIKRNMPISKEEQPRVRWPFAEMNVGDVIEIKDKEDWHKAEKYAHTLAGRKKWKMQTKWIKVKKLGRIRRIA